MRIEMFVPSCNAVDVEEIIIVSYFFTILYYYYASVDISAPEIQ